MKNEHEIFLIRGYTMLIGAYASVTLKTKKDKNIQTFYFLIPTAKKIKLTNATKKQTDKKNKLINIENNVLKNQRSQ